MKRILVGKRVPTYNMGGDIAASWQDPNNKQSQGSQYAIATNYMPVQVPMLNIQSFMPGPQAAPVTPSRMDYKEMMARTGDVHGRYAYSVYDKHNKALKDIEYGVMQHGENFIYTRQGKDLMSQAQNVNFENQRSAANAYKSNSEIQAQAKEKMNDAYIGSDGLITLIDPRTGRVGKIDVSKIDNAMQMGLQVLKGTDQWGMREFGWNKRFGRVGKAGDSEDDLVTGSELENMDDFRDQKSWSEVSKDLQSRFSGVGTTGDKTTRIGKQMGKIGELVEGITSSTNGSSSNRAQISSVIDSLMGEGGIDRADYNAFVKNFINKNISFNNARNINGPVYSRTIIKKDKKGNPYQVTQTADDAFLAFINKTAMGDVEDDTLHDETFNVVKETTQDNIDKMGNAGPIMEAHANLFEVNDGRELPDYFNVQTGGVTMSIPGVKVNLKQDDLNVAADGGYERTLANDAKFTAMSNMSRAQSLVGSGFSSQGLERTAANGQGAYMAILPTKNGKIALDLTNIDKAKLLNIQKSYTKAMKEAGNDKAKQVEAQKKQFRSISLQLNIKGGIDDMEPFTLVPSTGSEYVPALKEKMAKEGKKFDVGKEETWPKGWRAASRTTKSQYLKGAAKRGYVPGVIIDTEGVTKQPDDLFVFDVIVALPFTDRARVGSMTPGRMADNATGNASVPTAPKQMIGANREDGGTVPIMEEGGSVPEKKSKFTLVPITLQDF